MSEFFLISSGIKSLDRCRMKTSSSKYEYDLAKALSRYSNVTILSIALEFQANETDGNLKLIGMMRHANSRFDRFLNLLTVDFPVNGIVVFWGYDFVEVATMLWIKKRCEAKFVPFVFDHHGIATSEYSAMKKSLANLYFEAGKKLIRYFDAVLLFQKEAAKKLRLRCPYFVTKPGVGATYDFDGRSDKGQVFRVSYCGTLTRLNGVDLLIEAFSDCDDDRLILRLYGGGPLEKKVIAASSSTASIEYGGLVADSQLLQVYETTDLFVSMRRADDPVMKYAFPSKLFEQISTGKPMLTTKVVSDKGLLDVLYAIDYPTPDGLIAKISEIASNYQEAIEKGERAKQYVHEHFNYEKIASEIFAFLSKI